MYCFELKFPMCSWDDLERSNSDQKDVRDRGSRDRRGATADLYHRKRARTQYKGTRRGWLLYAGIYINVLKFKFPRGRVKSIHGMRTDGFLSHGRTKMPRPVNRSTVFLVTLQRGTAQTVRGGW